MNDDTKQKPENEEARGEVEEQAPAADAIDWKSKYYYLAAESENMRKRMERDKENTIKYGAEKIMRDMVDVVDNFERTVEMLKADSEPKVQNIVVGLDMVRKMFLDNLGRHGLAQIESLGKDFDPNFHEALSQEYVEGARPNEIIKEFQKGYVLNGRLLRAAKVVVASDKQ